MKQTTNEGTDTSTLTTAPEIKVAAGEYPRVGRDGKAWPQTIDARLWADEFCKQNHTSDYMTMLGWFTAAIAIGHDTAQQEHEDGQEAMICLTPTERREKQFLLNSDLIKAFNNMNMATPIRPVCDSAPQAE